MTVRPPSNARRSNLVTAAGLLAAVGIVGACAARQRGATPENLAMAESAVPNGLALFNRHCAACHGQRGEGPRRAPRILGPGALPKYPAEQNLNADPAAGDPELLRLRAQTRPAGAPSRDPFSSAEDLFRFVSKNMPRAPAEPGSLRPEEYWAIINFMLVAHGIAVPPGGVSAENASSVKF
jgi:mono/diheme cytochrome c family protein